MSAFSVGLHPRLYAAVPPGLTTPCNFKTYASGYASGYSLGYASGYASGSWKKKGDATHCLTLSCVPYSLSAPFARLFLRRSEPAGPMASGDEQNRDSLCRCSASKEVARLIAHGWRGISLSRAGLTSCNGTDLCKDRTEADMGTSTSGRGVVAARRMAIPAGVSP